MQKGLILRPTTRPELIFIMKCSVFLLAALFTITGTLLAGNARSQHIDKLTISLHLNRAGLKESLLAVERLSNIHFSLPDDLLAANPKKVTIHAEAVTVKAAIDQILSGTRLTYRTLNNFVVIEARQAVQQPGKISGKITDQKDQQPLPGITVVIGGKGVFTDSAGNFSIVLMPGTYTAEISSVGYARRTVPGITVKSGETVALNLALTVDKSQLGEVTIVADRVVTTNNNKLLSEIRRSTGVVSGISSEQITIGVDRSASEVVRRVAGVTLQNGFISIRGMTPRYNPVFLNNAFLPSTDPNKRAFNFDLLPSSVIDKIIVYKSAAPELPADFAGGVVKVYTKKSIPVRRFELSVNSQYRTGNKFFDNHTQASGGKYDWLGFDDGTRAMPSNMPRNRYGQLILPNIDNTPNNYTKTNEVITNTLLARSAKVWNLKQTYHPVDVQADATYYNYANIGRMKLNSVTVGRYENQRFYFKSDVARNANRYVEDEFPANGTPLTPFYQYNYRLSYDSVYSSQVRLAAMQHLSLVINPQHEITAMGLFNRNTKDVLQINTLKEWFTESASSLFPRRFENAYNTQDMYLGMVSGNHKMQGDKHLLEWSGSYSAAMSEDPNQFSNVFTPDDGSIEGDKQSFGRLVLNENTTWQLNTGTNRNTVVGRFADGEGKETRWQGNIDYTLKPFSKWSELLVRTGAYIEHRNKNYFTTTLAYRDYPEMAFSKDPWTNLGRDLMQQLSESGHQMHTGIQEVGLGLVQTNGYEALFNNAAGYLATNIPLSFRSPFGAGREMKLDIYGGVRMEYSKRRVFTTSGEEILYEYRTGPDGQREIVGTAPPAEQYFWLPSVAATLHLHQNWQLRMSYGKTLNRPDLRELSPYLTYNPADGATYIGKPTLHDARIDNYDLRLEWYPAEGETISAGLYYKNMQEPIEETMALTNTGIPGYTHSNLPFSRIYGAELEIRKKLDFINGEIFRHMGLIVNACYNLTEASNETSIEATNEKNYFPGGTLRPFMGAAPWIINAGLFYDNKASGSRFSLQYNVYGDRMLYNTSGVKESALEPWTFERSRNLLDISFLQKLNKRISLRVAAQNLLNSAIREYVDGDFNQHYNAEPTMFSWDIHHNNGTTTTRYIQGDYYIRNYKPGVYYSLGFQLNL